MHAVEKTLKEWSRHPKINTEYDLKNAILEFKTETGIDICLDSTAADLTPQNKKRLINFCKQNGELNG